MQARRSWVGTAGIAVSIIMAAATPAVAAPDNPAAPTSDAKPATRPAPTVRPPAATSTHADVSAVVVEPGGSTRVTFWEPAPGVSARSLHARLRAGGVAGLRPPVTLAAAAPSTCTWGTATTAFCPQIEWATNGHEDPQVYFVDHTTAAWPVAAAVNVWNQAQSVDSLYRWNVCPTTAGAHCVHVNSANYGNTAWLGETTIRYDAARNMIDGSVEVRFNNFHVTTAARKRKTVCHELGHVLGLGHNTSTTSCLVSGAHDTAQPNADDYALVADIYRS
jgi:hypothetical protein